MQKVYSENYQNNSLTNKIPQICYAPVNIEGEENSEMLLKRKPQLLKPTITITI